jgi:competence protein ComEA
VNQLREKILGALESTQTVNRRLFLLVFMFVLAVGAILVSLNSAKPYEAKASNQLEASVEASAEIQSPSIYVHVVGEVANPGMFMLEGNVRLFDAIFAAGGFTKRADQSSINLAREVLDGEQVVVLAVGAAPVTTATGGTISELISLNRASQLELETLPGVGPTLAGRIIDWRVANGGFKKKEDLLRVGGIGQKVFAAMKDKLTL